jgi:hypothetical protein
MSAPAAGTLIRPDTGMSGKPLGHTSKSLLTAGDDDGADVLVLVILGQDLVQLPEERAGKGIESFRAVEGD